MFLVDSEYSMGSVLWHIQMSELLFLPDWIQMSNYMPQNYISERGRKKAKKKNNNNNNNK